MTDPYGDFPDLRFERPAPGVLAVVLDGPGFNAVSPATHRQAGPIFDASLGLEFFGFAGPEVREGLASHRDKRAPHFG